MHYQALEKHLLGTAIDVFPTEPKSNNDEFVTPLRGLITYPNPSHRWINAKAQENIGVEVAELVRYSDNGSTLTSVNFPEVALPPHPNLTDFCIYMRIGRVCSRQLTQFCGESHQYRISVPAENVRQIGYVVIDVDRDYSDMALEKLSEIEGTVRCRVYSKISEQIRPQHRGRL